MPSYIPNTLNLKIKIKFAATLLYCYSEYTFYLRGYVEIIFEWNYFSSFEQFFYFNASLKLNKLKGGMNIWEILPIHTSHIRVQDLLRIKVAIYLRGPSGLIDLNSVAHQFHPNISQIYSMSSRANNV